MSRFLALLILSLALGAAGSARAADVESWNVVEFQVVHGQKWRVDCGGFVRVDHQLSDAYDDGLRCRAYYSVTPRLAVIAGMVQRWVDRTGKGYVMEERPFWGASFLAARAPVRTEFTTDVERFIYPSGRPSYTRFRSKVDLEHRVSHFFSPMLSNEFFFTTASGLVRSRTIAGFRHRSENGSRWELGYQFQTDLVGNHWVPKHAVRNSFYFGNIFHRN